MLTKESYGTVKKENNKTYRAIYSCEDVGIWGPLKDFLKRHEEDQTIRRCLLKKYVILPDRNVK